MPEYDFTGLSSRSFEKMVQALAVTALGTAVSVFGDGPDGGREATFEGQVRVDVEHAWRGYGVIQAKFRQRPQGRKDDAEWLVKELKSELAKYLVASGTRRKPEYYVIATNIVLTPASDRGGKDRVTELLRRACVAHGWKGFHVWDYDQLQSMLNGNDGVRRAFAAFITSGDVLSEVAERLALSTPDFAETLANFLAKELLSAQYANLEQAGYTGEERVPLSRVFVDLPYSDRWIAEDSESSLFLSDLIETACDRLDPESKTSPATSIDVDPDGGRYVLIGGPGQGKTTLGQFACQIFRAGILSSRPVHTLSPEVQVVIQSVAQACELENLSASRARRFPLHVTLSEFAASLAEASGAASLLEFVTSRISKRTGVPLSSRDVRMWLSKYPWMLLLDGLDEVPSSANRAELLRAIEEFWIDLAQLNADVLVLATTRPQGYTEEFSPRYYQHYWLVPLSPQRALHYAKRLVKARFRNDEEREMRLMARLSEATSVDATAKLMRSPLQITIMSTLLDQVGRAPQDRWRLFHEYYQAIFRREMERDTPAAALLSQYRSDIDVIHARVGLELQLEAERSGGTEARLTKAAFADIVRARVEEKGYVGSEAHDLAASIRDAAETRLVFLVSPTAETVGFEIRSLQEFMCAQALMSASTAHVQARLREIARIPAWHNVFVFAAGRCFASDEHLIDTIYSICAELNVATSSEADRLIRAGSALALDLLEDGVADRQPRVARLLIELALDLIVAPASDDLQRLAAQYGANVESLFRDRITSSLRVPETRSSGWCVLLALVNRGIEWADLCAAVEWPSSEVDQRRIFMLPLPASGSAWLSVRAADFVSRCGVDEMWRVTRSLFRQQKAPAEVPAWLTAFGQLTAGERDRKLRVHLSIQDESAGVLGVAPLINRDTWMHLRDCNAEHSSFAFLKAAADFAVDPSKGSLAALLRVAPPSRHAPSWMLALPWPASACFTWARTGIEVNFLADEVEAGRLGDFLDWQRAEESWLANGVAITLESLQEDLPFVAARPMPFFAASVAWTGMGAVTRLISLYSSVSSAAHRRLIAGWIAASIYERAYAPDPNLPVLSLDMARSIFEDLASRGDLIFGEFLMAVEPAVLFGEEWLNLADLAGQRRTVWLVDQQAKAAQVLLNALTSSPDRHGLLHLLRRTLQANSHAASEVKLPSRSALDCIYPSVFASPDAIQDALLLWASIDCLESKDVELVASLASEPSQRSRRTAFILANAVSQAVSDAALGEQLLLALYPSFGADERPSAIVSALSIVRAKRRSTLRQNWKTFGLPAMHPAA